MARFSGLSKTGCASRACRRLAARTVRRRTVGSWCASFGTCRSLRPRSAWRWSKTIPRARATARKSRKKTSFLAATRCNRNRKASIIIIECSGNELLRQEQGKLMKTSIRAANSIQTKIFALLAIIALATSVTLAHGDKKHVIGTVEKVGADSVVVKTAAGKSVEVKLVASTTYVSRVGNEDKPAKLSDLAVGDRVVIHATPKGETLEANEVKFSAAPASATAVKPKR